MASVKAKKKLSRLELLKKKLELEQEMLEKGKSKSSEMDRLEKELDEAEPEEKKEQPQEKTEEQKEQDKLNEKPKTVKQIAQAKRQEVKLIAGKLNTRLESYRKILADVRKEIGKIVVGQADTVSALLRAVIADGHVLVEGVPGIAKTTLIRALAQTANCSFARIQFTPDLLPTDIIGISTYQEGRGFYTLKGPIFNNFILADEINRAPPKVQSALLEAMAEKQATIAKESFPIPLPFFTMATQNPLENVGTYSLPEAQIDRFLFKLNMGYPNIDEEQAILRSNITEQLFEKYEIKPTLSPEMILQIQADAKQIYVDKKVERYIVRLVDATRSPKKYNIALGKYVEYGASPRGSIGLFTASRADALLEGQSYVTPHNVKRVAHDVLRHRLILSYEGQAEGVRSEQIIDEFLKKVPVP